MKQKDMYERMEEQYERALSYAKDYETALDYVLDNLRSLDYENVLKCMDSNAHGLWKMDSVGGYVRDMFEHYEDMLGVAETVLSRVSGKFQDIRDVLEDAISHCSERAVSNA